MSFILSIDQGTSSTKTIIFEREGKVMAKGSEPLHTNFFEDGFVEQDPEGIYQNVLTSVKKCLDDFQQKGHSTDSIKACGISNQRETFLVWDENGKPLHNAVVWQCKRSVKICERLKKQGLTEQVQRSTGLVIDPYFSATKLIWLNENVEVVNGAISKGQAYFGTIDTWLLYRLTNGLVYATDHTNASRTMFFNLQSLSWDQELIKVFGLEGIRLPSIYSSSHIFAQSNLNGLLQREIPIAALIGDSHAAAFGEGCFDPGSAKATLGTGSSIIMNIGNKPVSSDNGMVSTICWSTETEINYAFEGVIVSCGATIEWLKNELMLFTVSADTEAMATAVPDNGGVYLIPAFSGLGSPHWQMARRASITGLSFGTTKNHIVRAALESIGFQIADVINDMQNSAGVALGELHVNGGITSNGFVLQFIADLLNRSVVMLDTPDVSALGAARLAGLATKVYEDIADIRKIIKDEKTIQPADHTRALKSYSGWKKEIQNY